MNPDTNDPFEDHDPIEAAAMSWLIERDEGFAPGRAAEFERWRRASPQHAAAVERLEETWGRLAELATIPVRPVAAPTSPGRRFRMAIWAPLAAAAAIILAFTWWRIEQRNPRADYATVAGALQRVALPDGSVVTLNASSRAQVRYSSAERRVLLAAGEAHFEVARDEARPFLVTAGGVTVRAVGTAFNVRVAQASVEVVVASGQVRLTEEPLPRAAPTAAATAAPLLERGDRAILKRGAADVGPAITRLEPEQLRAALAWQQEMLIFEDTPLREVVAQFNRRNRTQLRLGDTALGDRLIGGAFAAGNVEAFVRLLERGGDLELERGGDHEIILRKAR